MDSGVDRCSNGGMRFDLETRASPAQVRRALTDFSDRRPQIWNRTLDPKSYQLLDSGDTWAVARESTAGSPAWVVSRYDWSDPDVVRWTVTRGLPSVRVRSEQRDWSGEQEAVRHPWCQARGWA